jgi:phosphate transport system permease protein
MLLAVPLSLIIAIYLVEVAHPKVSRVIGGGIELLAAVPSIIYGMWGLFVFAALMQEHVQPWLGKYFGFLPLFQGPPMGIGMLTAGLILTLMVLPFITAVTRDVLQMVPPVLKESAHGVGATMWEATRHIALKYGRRGIVGAVFLGFGRALGETMAVTFVIGNSHRISSSLFDAGNTIASSLANEFNEASEPIYLSSLFELALVLFGMTLLFQTAAHFWVSRMQRQEAGDR